MPRLLYRRCVRMTLAPLCLAALVDGTNAGGFTRGCAARDLQVLKLIEERERTAAVAADRLSDAMFAMMHARMVCFEGRVLDALALYDKVVESIPGNSLSSD